jgi:hypothetical protein
LADFSSEAIFRFRASVIALVAAKMTPFGAIRPAIVAACIAATVVTVKSLPIVTTLSITLVTPIAIATVPAVIATIRVVAPPAVPSVIAAAIPAIVMTLEAVASVSPVTVVSTVVAGPTPIVAKTVPENAATRRTVAGQLRLDIRLDHDGPVVRLSARRPGREAEDGDGRCQRKGSQPHHVTLSSETTVSSHARVSHRVFVMQR